MYHGLTGTDSSSVCKGAMDELLTLLSLAFGDGLNYTDKKVTRLELSRTHTTHAIWPIAWYTTCVHGWKAQGHLWVWLIGMTYTKPPIRTSRSQ